MVEKPRKQMEKSGVSLRELWIYSWFMSTKLVEVGLFCPGTGVQPDCFSLVKWGNDGGSKVGG